MERDPRLAARTDDIDPFRVMAVAEHAWALQRAGRDIIFLLAGEPDFGTPEAVVAAGQRSMARGRVHYTPSMGIPALREAIAGYYGERFGVDVPARRIVVTTGASSALILALAATVDRDGEILLADPGYPCNRHFVRLFEGRAVGIPMGAEDAYQLTASAVASSWGPRTQGVLLASPSNPTGTLVPPAELHAIADECAARRAVCIVDEIYGELVYDSAPATVLAHTDDAFVVNSFSKTWGMTGWRLGWLVCPDWAVDAVERLEQNLYISAPTVAQEAALACFTPEVWAEVERRRLEFKRRRDVLVDGLRALGAGVPIVPGGAFYVYADVSRFASSSTAWARRALDEAGVACTPGTDFGTHRAESHVRFSYTAPLPRIEAALDRLAPLFTP